MANVDSLDTINKVLGLALTTGAGGDCLRGRKYDEDGDVRKFTLDATDCANLGFAFMRVARTLAESSSAHRQLELFDDAGDAP